jgi:hypothetical protein
VLLHRSSSRHRVGIWSPMCHHRSASSLCQHELALSHERAGNAPASAAAGGRQASSSHGVSPAHPCTAGLLCRADPARSWAMQLHQRAAVPRGVLCRWLPLDSAGVALFSFLFSDLVLICYKFRNLYKFDLKSEKYETNFI